MKIRQIVVLTGIALFSQASLANITVQSFSLLAGQGCDNFAGRWVGGGTVKASVLHIPITCHYNGVATVSPTNGNYNVHVDLKRDAGICPENESIDLPGTCSNGEINLETKNAKLKGSMNPAGTEANLSGTVTITIGSSTVDADVTDMKLKKQ